MRHAHARAHAQVKATDRALSSLQPTLPVCQPRNARYRNNTQPDAVQRTVYIACLPSRHRTVMQKEAIRHCYAYSVPRCQAYSVPPLFDKQLLRAHAKRDGVRVQPTSLAWPACQAGTALLSSPPLPVQP